MPLYFFDFRDGDSVISDDEGIELSSFKVARDDAIDFVIATAKDARLVVEDRVFAVTVRDEGGAALFRTTLTIGVECLDPPA